MMIATQAASTQIAGQQQPQIRDSRWLTLEVCREFQRGTCSRPDTECKFAHPSEKVQVENGRVTACFDSLKGRCTRENCKYLHPPQHLKTQLEINGRNNLVNQRMMQQMTQFPPVLQPQLQALPGIPACMNVNGIPGTQFSPYLTSASTHGLAVFPEMFAAPMAATPTHTFMPHIQQKINRTDRLEVCREFQRGNCTRGENDCKYAHPGEHVTIDTTDNSVTVCMDYVKGRCTREKCKYFHPPQHLQAKVKAAQHQANQAAHAAAAAMNFQGLIPCPKRAATGMDKALITMAPQTYQQAMANIQLHQQHQMLPAPLSMNMYVAAVAAAANIPVSHGAIVTTNSAPSNNNPIASHAASNVAAVLAAHNQSIAADNIPVCRDFKSGNCHRQNCRFIHVTTDGHLNGHAN